MTDPIVNAPDTVASVKYAFETYEKALIDNKLDILDGYFWNSQFTVRFGVAENLYGAVAIAAYRRKCQPVGPGRTLHNTVITTFGDSFATVSTQFQDGETDQVGRQMQTWVRFAEGWKVVAAHVSVMKTPSA
ncbi:oxalurate catabolism protein HpxZ [Marinobacter sp. F3R11]|uniref:oxalurate catabolism protein HpxZ n=1 Tax=Marinobacter sp. F3R11 TaxID=2267231 RepID=UPI000DE9D0A2|nr:oxalurate catabolism protein HpxZ [Marinobacter sp. F3R11]RBW48799.1 oxalurate catabolism protein HpxZ [Marinobacter sp. F3R11]